jgi:hypothetical protein
VSAVESFTKYGKVEASPDVWSLAADDLIRCSHLLPPGMYLFMIIRVLIQYDLLLTVLRRLKHARQSPGRDTLNARR